MQAAQENLRDDMKHKPHSMLLERLCIMASLSDALVYCDNCLV